MSRIDRKQISFYVSIPEWRRIRDEAIRNGKTINDLVLEWIDKELKRLREREVNEAVEK